VTSEPGINNEHIPVLVKQQPLELGNVMGDLLLVDVPDTRYKLGEELGGVVLVEVVEGKDVVKWYGQTCLIDDNIEASTG
jgi:hypothetical protein